MSRFIVFKKLKPLLAYIAWPILRKQKAGFIVSTGRVGTSTMSRMLQLSPLLNALHEPRPLLNMECCRAYHDLRENIKSYRKIFALGRSRLLFSSFVNKKMHVEACYFSSIIPVIMAEMPHAKIIHLHRHPVDVVRSGMRRGWYDGHKYDYSRLVPDRHDTYYEEFNNQWTSFEKNIYYWHRCNEKILEDTAYLPRDKVLSVPFELFTNFESGFWKNVFQFLGVKNPDESIVKNILSYKYNSQKEGEFPSIDAWDMKMKNTLKQIAGDTMKRLDYSI